MRRFVGLLRSSPVRAAVIPALLAMAVVTVAFAEIAGPISYLWRPLIIAGAAGALIGIVAFRLMGYPWGALVAASLVLLLLRPTDWLALLPPAALLLVGEGLHRRGRRPGWMTPNAVASGIGIVLILLSGVTAARVVRGVHVGPARPPVSASAAAGPNIYLVLLDAYGRPDTLRSLGIDVDPFLDRLRGLGFDVYEDATSHFAWTPQTLAALFSGTTDGIPGGVSTLPRQRRLLQAIDRGPLIDRAGALGYELVVIDPPLPHVTFTAGQHRSHPGINAFEASLISRTPFATLIGPDVLVDHLRMRLDDDMSLMADLAGGEGRLVLAHFMVPHPPFLYARDGSELPGPACWPECDLFDTHMELMPMERAAYVEGLAGNVAAVNDRILPALERMIADDPDAVVVLFGDHGTRMSVRDKEEWRRPFLAARTPGRPHLFGVAPDPAETLRVVLDAYASD